MSTQQALLADIFAKPNDTFPRLVLADWLEEQQEQLEFAKFIRDTQDGNTVVFDMIPIEIGRDNPVCEQYFWHDGSWHFKLNLLEDPPFDQWPYIHKAAQLKSITYRAGFVDEISINASGWQKYYKILLRKMPLHTVRFQTRPNIVPVLNHFSKQSRGESRIVWGDLECPYTSVSATFYLDRFDVLDLQLLSHHWPNIKFEEHWTDTRRSEPSLY